MKAEPSGQDPTALGAYGFRITGLEDPGGHLLAVEPSWPTLRVEQVRAELEPTPPGTVRLDESRAEIWITDRDRVELDRETLTLRFQTTRPLADDVVVHPYLALPASIAGHWVGRRALHGGAFLHEGMAWGLLGGKEAGKSSTLGWLLEHGHTILTDDVLVLDEARILSGPRCIDLRGDAAERFGGEDLGVLGSRGRWRLRSGEAPASAPLAGFVYLGWGDRIALDEVPPSERIAPLATQAVLRPDPDEGAALPGPGRTPGLALNPPARARSDGPGERSDARGAQPGAVKQQRGLEARPL